MTAHIATVGTAAAVVEAASDKVTDNTEVASGATPANSPAAADTDTVAPVNSVTSVEAPQFDTTYKFTVTRVIRHREGNDPFLIKGFVGVGGNNIAGTVHASAIIGDNKTDRDLRFDEIEVGDEIDVELIDRTKEYRFSERLAQARKELTAMTAEPMLTAVVLEDAGEDAQSVNVLIGGKHKARLHASGLKESSREARDARIQTLKKDETIEVTIKSFARHPKFPVFQVACQEVGRQEKKPSFSKPARSRKVLSPLGNKTGDRAKAEAKRAARRQNDQTERNKMKSAGGGKK